MASQLRVEFENILYHITSRGDLRDKKFYDGADGERFLNILSRIKERYRLLLHANVLMDNHYSPYFGDPKANLSQIMQNINTSDTVYVNRKYQRSGHLLQKVLDLGRSLISGVLPKAVKSSTSRHTRLSPPTKAVLP